MENSGGSVIKGAPITGDGMGEKERERARERERETCLLATPRVGLQTYKV